MSSLKRTCNAVLRPFGYTLTRIDLHSHQVPKLAIPSTELMRRAEQIFCNSFEISSTCGMSPEQIDEQIGRYYWHYPFEFGGRRVESDGPRFAGMRGRHYQRYMHIFPAVFSLMGGSLAGKSVLDIACNAGFWSIQSRRAGATRVLGVDGGEKNIQQAKFIRRLIGLKGIDFRVLNAYKVGVETTGVHDVVLFLGLLYHVHKPVHALERLYEVTGELAVVDTTVCKAAEPMMLMRRDLVHDQNFCNGLAFLPSTSAVYAMLQHVGFRHVWVVQNAMDSLPSIYRRGQRRTFVAAK